MKIIIVGAGFTGFQLAKRLVSEKNDVVLIDNDEETVRHASNRIDCLVVQANGNSLETLESAGISKADALVALTESDEINMITCSLVDSVYPDVVKIARVRNYDYYANSRRVVYEENSGKRPMYGIDFMVHPDVEAAQAIVSAFEHGAAAEVLEFDNSNYEMASLEIEENSKLDGIHIQNIKDIVSFSFLITIVTRGNVSSLPAGNTILQSGDIISVLIEKNDLNAFLPLTGSRAHEIKRVAIAGAGKIGTNVAEGILKKTGSISFFSRLFDKKARKGISLVIIDKDRDLAKEASARFPEATVYNADITDESFIEEENLSNFDLVIVATRNHELNIVTSAYFKTLGCARSICLVSSSPFASIARNIGIDVAVPIKDAVVDSILSHLRGKSVTGIHTLSEGEFEIIEYVIPENSKVHNKQLKDLRAPDLVFLILLINKGEKYTIAAGNTVLQAGDRIVFLTETKNNKQVLEKFGE